MSRAALETAPGAVPRLVVAGILRHLPGFRLERADGPCDAAQAGAMAPLPITPSACSISHHAHPVDGGRKAAHRIRRRARRGEAGTGRASCRHCHSGAPLCWRWHGSDLRPRRGVRISGGYRRAAVASRRQAGAPMRDVSGPSHPAAGGIRPARFRCLPSASPALARAAAPGLCYCLHGCPQDAAKGPRDVHNLMRITVLSVPCGKLFTGLAMALL